MVGEAYNKRKMMNYVERGDFMGKKQDLTGERFGQLVVLERLEEKEDDYYCWSCQCDCGGKIKVNTRRLKRGTITNCGCIPKNNAKHGSIAEDIAGMRFGKLVAVKKIQNKNGRTAWECKCDCGNTHIANTRELKQGRCKSCGCLRHEQYRGMADIKGQRFGRLTVLAPTEKRDTKGSIYWHCRCDCGNEADVSEDQLVHGKYRSCGCFRKEMIWGNIHKQLHLIDGTCVEMLEKRKLRSDNKSGFRGVYRLKNGRYRVTIGFKGREHYIATVPTLDEAIEERMEAEKIIHEGFIEAYYKWKAEDNNLDAENCDKTPFIYEVEKINGQFTIHTNIATVSGTANIK